MAENKTDAVILDEFGYKQQLKRSLGFWGVVAYGMVFICPTAPLGIYGFVNDMSHGMCALVYIVGLAAMFFTALSYGVMIRRFPVAGSVYTYIQRAVNPHVGFIAGWAILLDYALIPAFIIGLSGVWSNLLIPSVPVWAWILIFIVWNTIFNILGITVGAKLNFGLLAIQFPAIIIFLIVGLIHVAGGSGGAAITAQSFFQPGKVSLSFIGAAASLAMVSFLGFDGMTTLAEETKNPRVTISRAIPVTLLVLGALFIVINWVADMIPLGSVKVNLDTEFFDRAVIGTGGAHWLANWLSYAMIISSAIGGSFVAQTSASRVLFSMGRDRVIPEWFGRVQSRFQTPYVAVLFTGAVILALAEAFSFDRLARLVNFGALTAFAMLNVGVIWFFFIREKARGAKGWLQYLVLPLVGFGIVAYIWSGLDRTTKIIGLVWMVGGIAYGAYMSGGYKEVPEALARLEI